MAKNKETYTESELMNITFEDVKAAAEKMGQGFGKNQNLQDKRNSERWYTRSSFSLLGIRGELYCVSVGQVKNGLRRIGYLSGKEFHLFVGNNLAAGDFFSRVPRGLGGKIIEHIVNNQSVSNRFFRQKITCVKESQCISAASEQRRKIPGMGGVRALSGIPVFSYMGKEVIWRFAADGAVVDMETVNIFAAGFIFRRQPLYFGQKERTAPAGVHQGSSPDIRIIWASFD